MTATVTKLNTKHMKVASIPDILSKMETADVTMVIHLTNGRWDLQIVKGQQTIWSLIGVFQMLSTHYSNIAGGLIPLKKK